MLHNEKTAKYHKTKYGGEIHDVTNVHFTNLQKKCDRLTDGKTDWWTDGLVDWRTGGQTHLEDAPRIKNEMCCKRHMLDTQNHTSFHFITYS